jgi:hypothetical protein
MAKYPKHLLANGAPDPDIWEVTRETRRDEEIIKDQYEALVQLKKDHIAMLFENLKIAN